MRRREFLAAGIASAGVGRATWPSGNGYVRSKRIADLAFDSVQPPSRPVPTPQQIAWQDAEVGLFVHFGINSFMDREWGDGTEDPGLFNPTAFDAGQWARAAKAGGFRYMVLTAKHHDGFCLWPTRLTDHSVARSPWRNGEGDVVREFVDAARAEGLGVGLYLSPWDRHEPSYGDSPRYNGFYMAQLTELLTGYGPLIEVWFDGANGEGPNGKRQEYDWPRVHRTVRELQPRALMFSDAGPDIRWIGNELGIAGDPNWCPVDPARVPFPGVSAPGVTEALQHGDPEGTVWRPGEADVSIRPGWFWHAAEDDRVRTADELVELYFLSVGRNANLLLNVPPTKDGVFHATDVARLTEFGQRIRTLFAEDLAAGAQVTRSDRAVELELRRPTTFAIASLAEDIAHGQRIAGYRLQAWTGAAWTTLARGTTIGHRRLARFAPVTASRVRLTAESALDTPRLGSPAVALYATG
ncbi:MAG TPA: alpha-L-fucosidase [Gemmatimonadales bacterium]